MPYSAAPFPNCAFSFGVKNWYLPRRLIESLSFPASVSVTCGLSSNFAQTDVLVAHIADIGINCARGPSIFGKTESISSLFFGSDRLKYFRSAVLIMNTKILFSKMANNFRNFHKLSHSKFTGYTVLATKLKKIVLYKWKKQMIEMNLAVGVAENSTG